MLHIIMAGSISAHFILRNSVDFTPSMILLDVVINALNMFDQPESTNFQLSFALCTLETKIGQITWGGKFFLALIALLLIGEV